MKKLYSFVAIILTIFICFGFYLPPKQVFAQSEYRRVINDTTPFYKSTQDQNPLFFLPYTYYVKVINQKDDFCHVEINGGNGRTGIDGYVPTEQLFYDAQEVLSPYLNLSIMTVNTTVLYADTTLLSPIQYIFAERSLLYFGEQQSLQGKLFYVAYNDKLGYVKESDIMPFLIANHPNKLTFLPEPSPDNEQNASQVIGDFSNLKTIIIVCLLLAGLIGLFIALSNKNNNSKKTNYYEENDYD